MLELIERFYSAISAECPHEFLDLLHEDIVWTIPPSAQVPYSGTYRGKAELSRFFSTLFECERLHEFAVEEISANEESETAFVLGREVVEAISTGKRFSGRWVHVLRFKEGLLLSFEEFIDTKGLAAAHDLN